MAKPRIVFANRVYWPSTAATAQLLTDLAEGLARRGWEVHVVAAGDGPARHNDVIIHRTGGYEQPGGLPSRVVNHLRYRRAAHRQLAALLHPGDLVVAMTDPPLLGAAITALTLSRGVKIIHWIQDIYPEIVSAHFGRWLAWLLWPQRRARDRSWQAATRSVTLGQDMAQKVTSSGVTQDRVVIVPNWAPRELHAPIPTEAIAARRAEGGVTGKFVVAYAGNLGRVHEFSAVIEAAKILRARRDIAFLFIGSGPRFDEVRSAATAHRLENIVFQPPAPREHLAATLAAADAHLVTLRPGFSPLVYPSKLAGVLAAGRAVLFVGPVDGEIARLIGEEKCGASHSPADGAGLAATIAGWQADPARCQHFGRQARAAYERRFTFAAALARWEEILRRAAG